MKSIQFISRALLLGSFIFSSCATAMAQDPDEAKATKKIVITFEIDDGPIRIVINGDDVDVELDGEPIDDERLEVDDNFVQIKNKHGWPVAFGNFAKTNFGFNFVNAPKMHAWLGVDLRPVSDALAEHMDLDQDEVSQIVSVTPDSPAEDGGLREHDIILEMDGDSPATGERLREILGEKEPGDELRLSLLRRG
ncbi:MAG: PDZ domain-containing protein, partial [Planctomycetota bacterium]